MKKYFIFILALALCIGCSEDNELIEPEKELEQEQEPEQIDYSTLSTEELLQTGGGFGYLVSQAKEIDFAALNERLKTEVLDGYANLRYYEREDGKWERELLIEGGGCAYCVLMDDNTFRYCFEFDDSQWALAGKWFRTYSAYDNAVVEMVGKVVPWAKIVAHVDNVLICEDVDAKQKSFFVCRLVDCREKVLNAYSLDYDDPEVIKKVMIENYEKRYNK